MSPSLLPNPTAKRICILLLAISCLARVQAQAPHFRLFSGQQPLPAFLHKFVKKAEVSTINENALQTIVATRPQKVVLEYTFEGVATELILTQTDIYSKGFFVRTADGKPFAYNRNQSVHYKGVIAGKPHSFAAISIFNDEVNAVLADEQGNINLGPVNDVSMRAAQEHIMYRDADLTAHPAMNCQALDMPGNPGPLPNFNPSTNGYTLNSEPVDVYFEADYRCYQNNGSSINNTINWATSLFNVVTALYENDSVNTRMSGIRVWNTPDPYISLSTSNAVLSAFASDMSNGFPGDLAHFLSQRSLGGGVAYVNSLCGPAVYRTGVSGNLTNSFNQLPSYSWSTMVITHETGHNIASNHTHWCGWPGGAIDNCYPTEGNCPPGPPPTNGGTMMSYCHLTGYGINLANGFGPLPGALIRNTVRNNSCIYPRISFSKTFEAVTEESADQPNGCLNYKTVNVQLAISYPPSTPAEITLLPLPGTGLNIGENQDVSVSPDHFELTDTTPQTIQIKVYDDAIVENMESLKLDYTLADNGTNARKLNTYQLDIYSLDHKPDSTVNQRIYSETFDVGEGWSQTVLYGDNSPNRWTIGNTNDPAFPGTAAFVTADGNAPFYAGSSASDSAVIRLESPEIDASGYTGLQLSYFYRCYGEFGQGQGSSGGDGAPKDFGQVYFSINGGNSWELLKNNIVGRSTRNLEQLNLPALANNASHLRLAFQWQNNGSVVNNPPLMIDSIVVQGTGSSGIQTLPDASNQQTVQLGPNQVVYFYNTATNNIMAAVNNKTNFDFGCTTLMLIRTGDTTARGASNNSADLVTAKAFRLITQHSDPTAAYDISLYYTNAEVNGWAQATGNSADDAVVLKTSGDINNQPVPTPLLSSNDFSAVPYSSVNGKVFTASFTGDGDFTVGKAGPLQVCAGNSLELHANEPGLTYQWQVNTGGGYVNLATNDDHCSGVTDGALQLNNLPTSWYGYKYRCRVTGQQGIYYTTEYVLRFAQTWKGGVDNSWETAGNWECGQVPDGNTDVYIKSGAPKYPDVHGDASVRTLTVLPGANVHLVSGAHLVVKD